MSEIKTNDEERDDLASVVMERYRRAKQYRESHIVHQGLSFSSMIDRADAQMRREYTADDAAAMERSFGFCPTRYMGVTQRKVQASSAWALDLVVNNLSSMFTAYPSPEPELDKKSLERIRLQLHDELRQRMMASGVADPALLLDAKGRPAERIDQYLQEQVRALKSVERSRIVSLASSTAQTMQTHMRDLMVQGNFRQAYMSYTQDRMQYGVGYIKFPDWRRMPVLKHKRNSKGAEMQWDVVPWFRHVRVKDFYPVCDAVDLQTNTGNTEVTYVTKAELITMSKQEGYFKNEIRDILDDYAYRTRNWIDGDGADDEWWELDQTIPFLIHEGYFSGDELAEYGITGIDRLDYVSAKIEVCGSRTVRCKLLEMPGGANRSFFGAPFNKIGDNLLDVLGMAAQLWDSEQRINRLMHLFEHNVDWASRPALMSNPSIFENPNDAQEIVPGGQYTLEERFATSGSMPEPIRPMQAVSAQYHLLMSQVGAILRQADEDCGIPAFAYGAQDFGRSSLGEYSQRMSNALRTIKQAALMEDIHFIEPAFKALFYQEMLDKPELVSGQDVGIQIRGMTGLLQEDQRIQRQQAIIPMIFNGAQSGIFPEDTVRYAARQLLEQAGFPVDALGMTDPVTDNALAIAASQPLPGTTPGGQQVPALDGRSGVPAANVATPTGASQLSVPGPSI